MKDAVSDDRADYTVQAVWTMCDSESNVIEEQLH